MNKMVDGVEYLDYPDGTLRVDGEDLECFDT